MPRIITAYSNPLVKRVQGLRDLGAALSPFISFLFLYFWFIFISFRLFLYYRRRTTTTLRYWCFFSFFRIKFND